VLSYGNTMVDRIQEGARLIGAAIGKQWAGKRGVMVVK